MASVTQRSTEPGVDYWLEVDLPDGARCSEHFPTYAAALAVLDRRAQEHPGRLLSIFRCERGDQVGLLVCRVRGGGPVTYPVTRGDGRTVFVTVPD